jgi:hypothetical protein
MTHVSQRLLIQYNPVHQLYLSMIHHTLCNTDISCLEGAMKKTNVPHHGADGELRGHSPPFHLATSHSRSIGSTVPPPEMP